MDTSESEHATLVDRNNHETVQTEIQEDEIDWDLIGKLLKKSSGVSR